MSECTRWDLVDGYNWNHCPGGLLREDFSKKPAFEALKDLLHNQWKTRVTLTSDHEGKVKWNGFFGTYTVNGKHLDFTSGVPSNVLVVR